MSTTYSVLFVPFLVRLRLLEITSSQPNYYIYIYSNRNSQTTSTKCQYHAAASNPKWYISGIYIYIYIYIYSVP